MYFSDSQLRKALTDIGREDLCSLLDDEENGDSFIQDNDADDEEHPKPIADQSHLTDAAGECGLKSTKSILLLYCI